MSQPSPAIGWRTGGGAGVGVGRVGDLVARAIPSPVASSLVVAPTPPSSIASSLFASATLVPSSSPAAAAAAIATFLVATSCCPVDQFQISLLA